MGMEIKDPASLPCVEEKTARSKYEALSPEDFLERAKNAERILENCRKN